MTRAFAEQEWKRLTGSRKPSQPSTKCYRFSYHIGLIRKGQRVIEVTTVRRRWREMISEIAMRRHIGQFFPNLARAA